jgi:pimeloyl-ACP methyl ester carboxylesterase
VAVLTPADIFIDVPGGRLFARRWRGGLGKRPPIILLHDSLGSVEQWRDFPQTLAAATCRDVIAYDRLGFGKSSPRTDRPSRQFILEEARDFFPAIQRALGLGRFILFGHSVGGAMALAIAASHGADCEAVITESAQAFVEPRTVAGIRSARDEFTDPAHFARLEKWHGRKARWVLDAWAESWLSQDFASWTLDPFLPRVTCAVLAIHGDLDEYGSVEFPRRITMSVKGPSELAILERCGHVPHRERSAEVLRLAATFLEAHAQEAS